MLLRERSDGSIVAVEVKASNSHSPGAANQLRRLRDRLDETALGTFTASVLLHMGEYQLGLGDREVM